MKNPEKVIVLKGKKFLLKVETSAEADDYTKYEALRNEIWGFPEDNLPGTRNLMCENFLHDGGALFIGAYGEAPDGSLAGHPGQFVGFSYGFVGVKDKDIAFKRTDNLRFYSQYTGVKQDFRRFGLAVPIKEFQREIVRDLFGISTITCTYDPLTGVNAWRNVHYFGMEVVEYRVSTYGEYGGLLNRLDVPSDRFFMSWDLRKKVRHPRYRRDFLRAADLAIIQTEDREIKGRSGGPVRLEIVRGVDLDKEGEFLLVQIPRDFYLMLGETDVEQESIRRIPLDWRLETRRAFQAIFKKGYRVVDFFAAKSEPRRNFYLLQK